MDFKGRAGVCKPLARLFFSTSEVMDQEFKPLNRSGISAGPTVAGAIFCGDFYLPEGFEHLSDVRVIVQREDKPAFY